MHGADLQRKKKKLNRRDDWPHTHKELFDAYVEEAGRSTPGRFRTTDGMSIRNPVR
jgi:hypothetical protein